MKNEVANKSSNGGKIYTRVVFLMSQNPYTDRWEPMALFPDLYWDVEKTENVSYLHVGQHGPCCKAYALLDCKVPNKKHEKAVLRLKEELESLKDPYVLSVIDSAEWMKQNSDLAREYEKNSKHYEQADEEQKEDRMKASGGETIEQMEFMDKLFDDGFNETKKIISEIFKEEFGDLFDDSEKDYSDLDDEELLYPPMVAGSVPDLLAELKARAA